MLSPGTHLFQGSGQGGPMEGLPSLLPPRPLHLQSVHEQAADLGILPTQPPTLDLPTNPPGQTPPPRPAPQGVP